MKIRAKYKSINPFVDINKLTYTKTAEVDDGFDMELLIEAARRDTAPGYTFVELINLDEVDTSACSDGATVKIPGYGEFEILKRNNDDLSQNEF